MVPVSTGCQAWTAIDDVVSQSRRRQRPVFVLTRHAPGVFPVASAEANLRFLKQAALQQLPPLPLRPVRPSHTRKEAIMKRNLRLIGTIALIAGCGESATAPPAPAFSAVAITSNAVVPVVLAVNVPCANGGAGELVLLSGNLHLLNHITLDGAGGAHFKTHAQPQGVSGTGLATGARYQGTGVTQETDNFNAGGLPAEFTFINNFRIIGQGPGNNFLVHVTLHMTVNENGETTADVVNASTECR
jgi:hypothetical protein